MYLGLHCLLLYTASSIYIIYISERAPAEMFKLHKEQWLCDEMKTNGINNLV